MGLRIDAVLTTSGFQSPWVAHVPESFFPRDHILVVKLFHEGIQGEHAAGSIRFNEPSGLMQSTFPDQGLHRCRGDHLET